MKTHEELFSHRNGYCDCVKEKKCTCGDTETQHYENTDKCVVCGCKEFEEVDTIIHDLEVLDFNSPEARKVVQDTIKRIITKTEADTLARVREEEQKKAIQTLKNIHNLLDDRPTTEVQKAIDSEIRFITYLTENNNKL